MCAGGNDVAKVSTADSDFHNSISKWAKSENVSRQQPQRNTELLNDIHFNIYFGIRGIDLIRFKFSCRFVRFSYTIRWLFIYLPQFCLYKARQRMCDSIQFSVVRLHVWVDFVVNILVADRKSVYIFALFNCSISFRSIFQAAQVRVQRNEINTVEYLYLNVCRLSSLVKIIYNDTALFYNSL